MLVEPQLWKALGLLIVGRGRTRTAGSYSYWHPLKGFILLVRIWGLVEFVDVTVAIGLAWGDHWWAWLIISLHAYGIVWVLGLFASFITNPHRIQDNEFVFADSCLLEGRIKLVDIARIERVREVIPEFGGRTGLVLKGDGVAALVGFGPEASIRITIREDGRIEWWGKEVPSTVRAVTLSADDPVALVADLNVAVVAGAA